MKQKLLLFIGGMTVAFSVFANDPMIATVKTKPTDTALPLVGINIKYVYRHEGSDEEFEPLTNNSTLYSGDDYKIIFTPSETSYVYIFQRDSSEYIYRLFPMKNFKGVSVNSFNPVQSGITYWVPGEDKSFYLDEQIGKETIYFLVTQQPEAEFDNPTGQNVLWQRLEKCEECVNILQFWHR